MLAALLGLAAVAGTGQAAEVSCTEAARIAEAREALPAGLLSAIGAVESRRGDGGAWPWTVQAAGTGRFFASATAATMAVRALHAAGVQSIDIGCFQINLAWHPGAFADVASGFAPQANAFAAARFLRALHAELGTWEAAVAAYHSRTRTLGGPYRAQVLAVWRAAGGAAPMPEEAGWVRIGRFGSPRVSVWGPAGRLWPAAGALAGVITPATP
jgi:hypothetical protein